MKSHYENITDNYLFHYFPGTIQELLATVKKSGSKFIKSVVAPVCHSLVDELAKKGINIGDEYKHVIDNSAINHILECHGIPEKELQRGQLPVKEEDIIHIPNIVNEYDCFSISKNKRGQDVIIYQKSTENEDVYYYVEEIRVGRRELAAQTMYKKNGKLTDANREPMQSSDSSAILLCKYSETFETSKEIGSDD